MASTIQNSFSAGELSPTLFGRQDLAKYHVGAASMRNFFVDYRGGASTRPGTRFVARCKRSDKAVRLIRFQFNNIQQYILEFGELYMRVHFNGAPVLEPTVNITGATQATPCVITTSGAHGYSTGDTVFITGVGGMTQLNGGTYLVTVLSGTTFSLQTLDGVNVNATAYGAFTSGGTVARVFTLTTPYAAADLALLKFTQSADTMTLTHPSYKARDLTRTQHWAWTLSTVSFGAAISAPGAPTLTASAAGTATFAYCVTAVDSTGNESLPSPITQAALVNIATTAGWIKVAWAAVSGAAYYKVYKSQIAVSSGTIPVGSMLGYIGVAFGNEFLDGNITPDFTTTPPQRANPFANGAITGVTVSAGGTGYTTASVASVSDATGSGAALTPVIVGGVIQSFIITNGGSGYTSPTITVTVGSGFSGSASLSASSGNDPGVVTYFQQRKVFAASLNFPATLWGSKPGGYSNFDVSTPVNDGNGYTYTIASNQVNAIRSLQAMPGGLVIFTSGGVWQLRGGNSTIEAVTPTSASANPQAYTGVSDVPPIAINYDILYVQDKGSIVRNLSYNFFAQIYTSEDRSYLSNHLFSPHYITEWTYAEEPFKVIWGVREDGIALSFTFMREQDVYGWARHDTQGLFQSVSSIQEGKADAVYFVVKRFLNGQWVQNVERMEQRYNAALQLVEQAWCVDCGLSYVGSMPAAGISVSAATGTVTITADASVFNSGMIGSVLRTNGGKIILAGFTSGTVMTGTVDTNYPLTDVLPTVGIPKPVTSGNWSVSAPITVVTGLTHLAGQTVQILADGNVKPAQVVSSTGTITLDVAASYIIVGLGFQCQLVTLPLDGQVNGSTIQGKRKSLSDITLKVTRTRGLRVGPSWDQLTQFKERQGVLMGQAIPAFDGDQFTAIDPGWDAYGQLYMEQDYPLPATILAVVQDVSVGDIN